MSGQPRWAEASHLDSFAKPQTERQTSGVNELSSLIEAERGNLSQDKEIFSNVAPEVQGQTVKRKEDNIEYVLINDGEVQHAVDNLNNGEVQHAVDNLNNGEVQHAIGNLPEFSFSLRILTEPSFLSSAYFQENLRHLEAPIIPSPPYTLPPYTFSALHGLTGPLHQFDLYGNRPFSEYFETSTFPFYYDHPKSSFVTVRDFYSRSFPQLQFHQSQSFTGVFSPFGNSIFATQKEQEESNHICASIYKDIRQCTDQDEMKKLFKSYYVDHKCHKKPNRSLWGDTGCYDKEAHAIIHIPE